MSSNTNFATWNPLTKGSYTGLFNGNTTARSISNADLGGVTATIGITTGKWYWETYVNFSGTGYVYAGLSSGYEGGGFYSGGSATNGMTPSAIRLRNNGTLYDSSGSDDPDRWGTITLTSTGVTSFTNGDIIGFALDYDNKKLWISKNGTFFNSGNPAGGSNQQASWTGDVPIIYPCAEPYHTNNDFTLNAGQDSSFSGQKTSGSAAATDGNGYGDFYYTPPTDYLAVCAANLPTSSDIDPAGDNGEDENPTKQFNVVTYTGDGSTSNAISNLGFSPDLVWIGQRSSPTANYSNGMFDTSRGRAKVLYSHRSDKQPSDSSSTQDLVSFDSDGFTVGTNNNASVNASSKEMVAWCWKCAGGTTSSNSSGSANSTVQVNTKAGFSISLTDNYGAANGVTIGHGLGKKPAFYLHKTTGDNSSGGASQAFNWHVYHHSLGATNSLFIHLTNAAATAIGYWNNTEPTTDVLSLGNLIAGNGQSVVFAWAEIDGYSKFGSYNGSGNSAGGPFCYTGFRPRLLMIKNSEQSSNWVVLDSARQTFNPNENYLRWNTGEAEGGTSNNFDVDFLSNGFKVRSTETDLNTQDKLYVYAAWGDVPTKYGNTF